MLNNYVIPPKNDCLTHVDPNLYPKCALGIKLTFKIAPYLQLCILNTLLYCSSSSKLPCMTLV
jgi:hypothetical protein